VAVLAAGCARPTARYDQTAAFEVSVTAYCLRGKTASGLEVRNGIAAADIGVLPIGSVIRLRGTGGEPAEREGIYTVLDTGRLIRGRRIDLYVPDCANAVQFGRRTMVAEVLRHGWAPDGKGTKPERP